MTEQRVARLYDALHAFEARRRGGQAYPVHKRLSVERFGDRDIYDWIAVRIEPRRQVRRGRQLGRRAD